MSVEQSEQSWYEKVMHKLFRWMHKTNKSSHGYVPLFLWLALLFGGIWFPAGPVLRHVFENGDAPVGILFDTVGPAAESSDNSTPSETVKGDDGKSQPAPKKQMPFYLAVVYVPTSFFFWSWSNIALLCVMAAAMGEVNRHAEENRGGNPDYRSACTRAFFVYLFVLLNEIAIVGTLTPQSQLQGGYSRIAILASLFAFVASYRPTFYQGMISTISAMGQNANNQQESPLQPNEENHFATPEQQLINVDDLTKGKLVPAVDDFEELNVDDSTATGVQP